MVFGAIYQDHFFKFKNFYFSIYSNPDPRFLQLTKHNNPLTKPSPITNQHLTLQNIQSSPSISTSPPVNPPNPSTTILSLLNPEPSVAFASSPQNLNTAPSTVDNLLAFEDHYENESLRHHDVETYVPTTTNCNEPIIPLSQPTCSAPIPITTNAEQNLSGIKTWAQNLPSPQTYLKLNQAQTFPNALYTSTQTSLCRTSNPLLSSSRPMFLYLLFGNQT